MNYPYLLSSLPIVQAGRKPAITLAQVREEAQRHLAPADLAIFTALADGSPCDHPFVRNWRSFETQLRNACVRERAARRGVDPKPHLREQDGCDGSLDRRVQAAFQSSTDPLARERALDALRLERLESLPEDPFSLEAFLAYWLRLEIATRQAAPDPEAGRARLRTIVENA